ncbi:Inorganic diphosphatase [Fusarium falciforme]|uniref:Inorganic diphosphatase n=1 Tax=Fusarium falciforme TaxID=195108 RepID=UPI002300F4E5|nr:Inorganic diphosphatase [Fusarium falciforme]WAO83813.1 Inorganic diphosphatase [Fusarium falciforme]
MLRPQGSRILLSSRLPAGRSPQHHPLSSAAPLPLLLLSQGPQRGPPALPLPASLSLSPSLSRGPGRANHMSHLATRRPGARPSLTQQNTPPPPSTTSSSSSTLETSSRRTAQLARHFTSSPSSVSAPKQNKMASPYTVRKVAAPNTLEHRVYIEQDGQPISPFHDIPLYANQEQTILNMVVEIPRWTNAKLEISKEELLNPIKQDIKKGKLRYVRNCFPHKGYLWNYGAFPQTWEDPNSIHPETKAKGDNDPLDVCEIGELVGYTGQVKQVKVLGVMALLDEEETDWKVIVIDINDPLAAKLNDVEDVERHLPGLLRATNEWFRIYKIPDGKPENQFAFTGECKNKSYALDVVRECAEAWDRLITGKTAPGGVSTTNVTVQQSPSRVSPDQLPPLPPNEELPAEKIDSSIDKWFFISGASA